MGKYTTGIALGGGGARGFAHLGIMKALQEKGIYPDLFSGVSAGAIAGVFLAAGFSPEETYNILKENGFFKYSRVHFPKTGLLSLEGLKEIIEKHIEAKDIQDLKHPLIVTVSNITDGKVEYIDRGNLGETILASCSIPILFAPVEIGGKLYVDGGLFDNLPIKPLQKKCKHIIAANISPLSKNVELDGLVQIATRIFHLSIGSKIEQKKDQCDLFIEPDGLRDYHTLAAGHADELFELGYKYARKVSIPWGK